MTPDLARNGLANLQQRMLKAVVEAPDPATLIQIQHDLVTGATRLEDALTHEQRWLAYTGRPPSADLDAALTDVHQFRLATEEALACYEPRSELPAPSPLPPAPP